METNPETSLLLYHRTHLDGLKPDTSLLISALKSCSRSRDLRTGKKIHAYAVEARETSDIYLANTLVSMYSKCRSMHDAQRSFDSIPNPTVVSWSSLLSGYAENGQGDMALDLLSAMKRLGCIPNRVSFLGAIKACSSLAAEEDGKHKVDGEYVKVAALRKGKTLHMDVRAHGHESNTAVASSLIDMYSKCGCMKEAQRVFDRMRVHDVVAWNCLILGYAENGDGLTALKLFTEMKRQRGIRPNERSYVAAAKACACLSESHGRESLVQARALHEEVQKAGLESNIFVASTLVDMFSKCGSLQEARAIFERMPVHDAVAWNAIILGYVEAEEYALGLELYQRMQDEENCQPNRVTFVAALKACCGLGALELGRNVEARILDYKMEKDVVVATSLVDFYGKCSCMEDAQRVFDSLATKGQATWNALIAGYSRQGGSTKVFQLFGEMQRRHIEPNEITFLCVLAACCHSGLVEEGKEYFHSMHAKHSLAPTAEHCTYMVDLLGGVNRLEEALTLINAMPFQPSLSMWITLLGACRKWRNVPVGRVAFEGAVRLDERKASAYLLMATLYEEAGLWEESAKVQAMQKAKESDRLASFETSCLSNK